MIKLKKLISEDLINEATRSQIGVITKNGNILSTYVHYDGYPDGVGATAKKYYSGGKVNQLLKIDGGVGISVLDKKLDGGKDHSFANPAKDQTIFYGRDRGEKGGKHLKGYLDGIETYIKDAGNKAGADYVYLYNEKDKKWYYADVYSYKELKLLEGVKESVNEGKHDAMLDKLADIVKDAKSFMDIGSELKKNGIKYSFGTSPLPMYIIDKPAKIAILNNKYADGAERVVGTTAIGLMESIKESINESKYTVVNPKNGNVMGQGMKDQAAKLAKKMGGEKMGYFVIPVKNALKARRALEKFNFDVKNPKLKDIMSDLYFEEVEGNKSMKLTSIMEGYSTEEKRIVLMAVKKIMKYMNVDIKTAMMYVLGAGQELERDIEKGKVK